MTDKVFPQSQLPIRRTVDLLPQIFKTNANEKFMGATVDPLVQPGVLQKTVGYVGRRYGKTFNGADVYLDDDETLRSRYQLEPGVVVRDSEKIQKFYDYIDFKNQLKFFGNNEENDNLITSQEHYSWSPPIDWDKFVNFREYYWEPEGPPLITVTGQAQGITSTYRVKFGSSNSYILFPDGVTNNPTVTLYRGQKYKFIVNAPGEGFTIRSSYDTGSLRYNPDLAYEKGTLVLFDNKLWRAKTNVPQGDGSTIDENSQDWEYVEPASEASSLDYSNGITNNGIENGTLTFDVPFDAPDVLYYQSKTNPDRLGRFIIGNIESNTKLDVEKEIIGKTTYTSSNGIVFSNGLKVKFAGQVLPEKYATDEAWIVEGVGFGIRLVKFSDLVISSGLNTDVPEVLFDNAGFDTEPFDDATYFPGKKDYITINRASQDANPWSRYNRWFHRTVLEYAYKISGSDFDSQESLRAKRPIIEFTPNLQLFNHGSLAKEPVDYIDDFTTDVFSKIEGSRGYNVDGEELFQGARVLFTADTDSLVNNKIYTVNFINQTTVINASQHYDFSEIRSTGRIKIQGKGISVEYIDLPYAISAENTLINIVNALNTDPVFSKKFVASKADLTNTLIITALRNVGITASEIINYFTVRLTVQFGLDDKVVIPTPVQELDRIRQISLIPSYDSDSVSGECLLIKRGKNNQRLMYHFDGINWIKSQLKESVNQAPLFDVFDNNEISFSNAETYPVSSFKGTEIFSYRIGNGLNDSELGFPLSYLNIDNVGDIQFDFDWELDILSYQIDQISYSVDIKSGFYKNNLDNTYANCWELSNTKYFIPIIDTKIINESTSMVEFNTVDWFKFDQEFDTRIDLFVNNKKLKTYTRNNGKFIFDYTLQKRDTVTIKLFCKTTPDQGYYAIPVGLEKNPLNDVLKSLTYGTVSDHLFSAVEFYDEFEGSLPGLGNLRDLYGFQSYGNRILKHSGIAPLAISMLCDKEVNIIKSIQYAKKQYTDFKNSFIDLAAKLNFTGTTADLVDDILLELSKTKTLSSTFADSDMAGSGAYSEILYTVEDEGINTFALSEKFDLETPSRKAVYVYLNDQQLINAKDYVFDKTFGFVRINSTLAEGDTIKIKEYISTANNCIPPTPTKLGLYRKYLPQKFIDDTYVDPKEVIQGHDGSITIAYGDFRDDVLLELEYRIYNNIKKEYDTNIFDIDKVMGGYYGNALYSKEQVDPILDREFLRWLSDTNIDFVNNVYFDSENSFTYTYSNMTDSQETVKLPGYWRGVYKWFYDTDRPHRCPWEMLGFSEKPTWWEDQYGPAPYTANNLILWEDLRDGIIRQGTRAGVYERYKRSTLIDHIPVDGDGNLLSPLDSNLATNFTLINNKGDFKLGDVAPVEYAWRSSSEYPFAVVISLCLLKPFEYISDHFDNISTEINKLGQTVSKNTKYFPRLNDITVPIAGQVISSGLIIYVENYLKSKGIPETEITNRLQNLDVAISTRLSGFVDQGNQKYVLDSKNPSSSTGSVFIPPENYDIIFNVSSPIASLSYSGVLFEKTDKGWKINGYDQLDPYFTYYEAVPSNVDPLISVGGVSENFLNWAAEKFYGNGVVVRYNSVFYRSLKSHTSSQEFEESNWKKLPQLPTVGGVEAFKRRNFNRLRAKQLVYGTVLTSVQQVVDFLLGYETYLKEQGFIFEGYSSETLTALDWFTACKEFMFWTKHNWEVGSLLTVSPAAENIVIKNSVGVVDNLLDSFYDYSIFKSDGTPLSNNFLDVVRDFQTFKISTVNTNEGIYYLKVFFVLKEHVTIFNDRTVFNDVIYDKTTGYRQERIKSRGFRTVDWDGDYTSPGFIFDNVNIQTWTPYTDYKLGDIVSYKSYNWVSKINQPGTEEFNDSLWSKLDTIPEKKLVPNFDYRINQFEDYYNLDNDGVGESQRELGRHSIGYQSRQYLQSLSEDEVTQFQLYQGFIREKGTANSIIKVFDKTSKTEEDSILLKEEWAFRLGRVGGVDQVNEVEFFVSKDQLQINPQPLLITETQATGVIVDQYLRVDPTKFTISPDPFTKNINSLKYKDDIARNAGFVKLDQIALTVKTRDDLLTVDIDSLKENDHIWITFDLGGSWSVLRYNQSTILFVQDIIKTDNKVEIIFNRPHAYELDQFIGIKDVPNLTGFFKIVEKSNNKITVEVPEGTEKPEFDPSTITYIQELTEAKFETYSRVNAEETALLKSGSRIWIEKNVDQKWEVIERTKQYNGIELIDSGISNPLEIGFKVIYADTLAQTITSVPRSNLVLSYKESISGLSLQHIIAPPEEFLTSMNFSWGKALVVSPDGRWLIVGAPNASGLTSAFKGNYSPSENYFQGEIVLYEGRLWKATDDIFGDGTDSTNKDIYSQDWEPAVIVEASPIGLNVGPSNQGCVAIYEWSAQQWNYRTTLLSPYQTENENFGETISIGKNGNSYVLSIAAPGAANEKGRVYLYTYSGNSWSHLIDTNYAGVYQSNTAYPAGTIVWYDSKLFQAQSDILPMGDSTIGVQGTDDWVVIDPVTTQFSLPRQVDINDDGSTLSALPSGLLTVDEISELTKQGDRFGTSMTMSRDGEILVIGSPYSDGQFFNNFRGDWKSYQEYVEGDVVRYEDNYYRLIDIRSDVADSTVIFTSIGVDPSDSEEWINVGDSTDTPTGKVFIYQRTDNRYVLKQTITSGSLSEINDTGSNEFITSGDKFGYAVDIDYSATTLVISSPEADINLVTQGVVYVFRTDGLANLEFRLTQKLESYEKNTNELFGSSVAISAGTEQIVVGAKNSSFKLYAFFDQPLGTTFDQGKTIFSSKQGYPGQVYVFQRKDNGYLLGEKLESNFTSLESFGSTVDCTSSIIVVGSPNYITTTLLQPNDVRIGRLYKIESLGDIENPTDFTLLGAASNTIGLEFTATADGTDDFGQGTVSIKSIGKIRLFKKNNSAESWNTIALENKIVDVDKIKNISLFDEIQKIKIADVDFVDHQKSKILGIAEQEIKFKTLYDPAIYSVGTDEQIVDNSQSWREKHIGEVWWDLSTVKWITYEQGDAAYRIGNWNSLATGATVDVYEWVETPLLPSEWSLLADTTEGLAEGISGQPLYPNDTVYSIKTITNPNTGLPTGTLYYFWVKNKTIIPDVSFRKISISEISDLIENPAGSGIPIIAFIDQDKFLLYNFDSVINNDQTVLNIEYKNLSANINPIHTEYQLLTEGQADSLPSESLERKWLDSLIGFDEKGNTIPDPKLPIKQKYGINFRPRQTMFVDREKALKIVIDNINAILDSQPFVDIINFENLNEKDNIPDASLNEYDTAVDSFIDLSQIGTARVRQAILEPILVDGEIESIQIIDSGFGYRTVPFIEIEGDGVSAAATITIDNQGRVTSATVLRRGRKYSTALVKIRPFSVLVRNDNTANNYWSIYSWDQQRLIFYRSKSQGYDTTRYWEYKDWWKLGYSASSRIVVEIDAYYLEPTLEVKVGDLIRIKEYGNGGWAVIERSDATDGTIDGKYILVGRQNGTIKLKDSLYNKKTTPIGFDNVGSYDTAFYDLQPSTELRFIFKAVKNDIFTNDLSVEWNKLFFKCVNFAFSEQEYIDWAFKTSFLNAVHNVGPLEQRISYKNDNLESYKEYLEEVKPYRTTIREYTSRYINIEQNSLAVSDFDLPPSYSVIDGRIMPVGRNYDRLSEYPWKFWADNNTFSVTAIEIADGGSDYTSPPTVVVEGTGSGVKAQAYISNGKVSAVRVLNEGIGFTSNPIVTLVGGNGFSQNKARAVAIMGNSKARTFDLTIKFDRIAKKGTYVNFSQSQTFIANGVSSVFELNYAPTRDKSKIFILKNNQLVLNNEYSITLYYSMSDTYNLLRGKLIFAQPPMQGDIIEITYDKNDELLDSVNRIEKYYAPRTGMPGKELNQLMTGIDYGGVQIQGTTFDVTGGWDALPWFTDGWDSVESSSDFYYVVSADQTVDSSQVYKVGSVIKFSNKLYTCIQENITSNGTIILPGDENWQVYWDLFKVALPYTPEVGQLITIYYKKAYVNPYLGLSRDSTFDRKIDNLQITAEIEEESKVIRIDDPYFLLYDGSTMQPNGRTFAAATSVMPTFVGDGSTNVVEFYDQETELPYLNIQSGDTLIFRTVSSDGSVTIKDVNLIDTNLSGGTLSAINSTNTKVGPNTIDGAYATAAGIFAEEIIIDGDQFITPQNVPATEENVPGQVLDSVSIKVFNTTITGAAPLQNKVYIGNGAARIFDIGLEIVEAKSLVVYIDKVKKSYEGLLVDYTIDFISNTIQFLIPPAAGSIIELISIGIGGVAILDYQEFVADGETSLFLTKAKYNQTTNVCVTVDGNLIDIDYLDSTNIVDQPGLTLIQFGLNPERNQVIKIISLGADVDTDSSQLPIIRVNKQSIVHDGSTRSYDLDGFVNLSRGSSKSSVLVSINGIQLTGVDTIYEIYNGTNNNIRIGIDPEEAVGNITSGNIRVFINKQLKRFVIDYVYDGNNNLISIPESNLVNGDEIKIENDLRAQFDIVNNNLLLLDDIFNTMQAGDIIEVTWFSEYPSMDIISDEFSGGKVRYQLSRIPLNVSYVWVYKNGERLSQDQDYKLSLPNGLVYLNVDADAQDEIKIVQYGSVIKKEPIAYEIFKDMLNVYHYKRYSQNVNVKLTKDLTYYDTTIEVSDARNLYDPIVSRNIPGVIIINNERIEYLSKNGNTLSQLRRGSLGTAIAEIHEVGSYVVDSSKSETVPYAEEQQKVDFTSDGSSLLIGPLEFIPSISNRSFYRETETVRSQVDGQTVVNIMYPSIPLAYGPCDELEVFVGGRRLRKSSQTIYSESLGSSSPSADIEQEAEFSVDGTTAFVRLTSAVEAGTRITIIKRTGRSWYDRGENSATSGKTFLNNSTPMIRFISEKSTELPE